MRADRLEKEIRKEIKNGPKAENSLVDMFYETNLKRQILESLDNLVSFSGIKRMKLGGVVVYSMNGGDRIKCLRCRSEFTSKDKVYNRLCPTCTCYVNKMGGFNEKC